nr:hypothetical protein [Natronococcus occultus]
MWRIGLPRRRAGVGLERDDAAIERVEVLVGQDRRPPADERVGRPQFLAVLAVERVRPVVRRDVKYLGVKWFEDRRFSSLSGIEDPARSANSRVRMITRELRSLVRPRGFAV